MPRCRRPNGQAALPLLDLGAIAAAALLAHWTLAGPEAAAPARAAEGAIGEVRAYGLGRLAAGDAILRFAVEPDAAAVAASDPGGGDAFAYDGRRTRGAMIRLAVERGDAARVELNETGRIVGVSVDGRRLLEPAEAAGELRRLWLGDVATLAAAIGLYLAIRPRPAPAPPASPPRPPPAGPRAGRLGRPPAA